MRKLATIRRIDNIEPIEGADAIDVATVGGWKVVVKKNEFSVNDLAVYLEIDSWVPQNIAPFLFKGRSYFNVPGERLRTVKLRGQVSQGLVLPLDVVIANSNGDYTPNEDDDVTELLGIQKWEAEIPAQLSGLVRGAFPSFIRKTDSERIQNFSKYFNKWKEESVAYEITEKLEGSSMTVYLYDGNFGVCSRNLDLQETTDNVFWKVARYYDFESQLRSIGSNIALQMECCGLGIQKNIYNMKENRAYIFDVWDINQQRYLLPPERDNFLINNMSQFEHVPFVSQYKKIDVFKSIDDILLFAEGKSFLNPSQEREGVVFKTYNNNKYSNFKAISNKYLLKNQD